MADARSREREAMEEAMRMPTAAKLRVAILAYGRAVREADREAAEGNEGSPKEGKRGVNLDTGEWRPAEYWHGRAEAASAIEALEKEEGKT